MTHNKKFKWAVVQIARLILSLTFIFSGVVKVIDPRGFEYKLQDYARAMGLLDAIPMYTLLFAAATLAVFEFAMGIYLFFGIRRKLTASLVFLMMLIMTPITFWVWIWEPVKDCGCFGDAVQLTGGETFAKNIILLTCSVIVLCWPRLQTRVISEKTQWTISLYSWLYGGALCAYCIYTQPIMDFRPYHIGADLLKAQEIPEDSKDVSFHHTFLMEKDGVQKEFTLEDYPDSTWTFIKRSTRVEGPAEQLPEIHDLSITDIATGEDVTEELLSDPNWKFLIVSPHLEFADDGVMDRLAELTDYCSEHDYALYCLTASPQSAIDHWADITGAEYPFLRVDETPLKTMVRSNPGLLLLHGPVVVNKFPTNQLPKEEELTDYLENLPLGHVSAETHWEMLMNLLLWFIIPLMVITMVDRSFALFIHYRKNRKIKKTNINQLKIKQL